VVLQLQSFTQALKLGYSEKVSVPLAKKLMDHRLKPGGVMKVRIALGSWEIEGPPAKAWWCP
jgi:hypothetical protein